MRSQSLLNLTFPEPDADEEAETQLFPARGGVRGLGFRLDCLHLHP